MTGWRRAVWSGPFNAARGVVVMRRLTSGMMLMVLASACATPRNEGQRPAEVHMKETKSDGLKAEKEEMSTDGLLIRRFDLNRDEKPDMVKYYKVLPAGEQLVRSEFDLNFDGKPDVWRFYDERKAMVKERIDFDFDGVVDSINHFEAGTVVRKEVDLNFDGSPDLYKLSLIHI